MLKKQSIALLVGCTLIINPLQASLEEQEPQTYNEANLPYQSSHSIDPELVKLILTNAPEQIKMILHELKNGPIYGDSAPKFLYLYGPPGCGKSTLAKIIAQKAGRACKFIHAQELRTRFKDSVSDNLNQIANAIINSNIPYVLIIDEVEAITEMHDDPQASEKGAYRALMNLYDKLEHVDHVLVIFTSNSLDKIPAPLKQRFEENIVEIQKPDEENKKDIIRYYLQKRDAPIDEESLKLITGKLQKRSAREIMHFVNHTISLSRYKHGGQIIITKELVDEVYSKWKKISGEKSWWKKSKETVSSCVGNSFVQHVAAGVILQIFGSWGGNNNGNTNETESYKSKSKTKIPSEFQDNRTISDFERLKKMVNR